MTDRRHRYQLRFKAPEAVYQRLLREAASSGSSLSEIVRDAVIESLAARDATADLLSSFPLPAANGRRLPLALLEFEQRLADRIDGQRAEMTALDARMRGVEAMIDRLYAGLMLHLPEVPADVRRTRSESASVRYRAWLAAVDEQRNRTTSDSGLAATEPPRTPTEDGRSSR